MNWKEFTVSALTTRYEAKDDLLAYKLSEIEEKIEGCVKLASCYELSRKLFALLQYERPSRQLTEGFERLRKLLYAKQGEIMNRIEGESR